MNNQIKLKDGETLTWAIYENGSGVLSLVLFAESEIFARPVAALFNVFPWAVAHVLEDLDMIHVWEGVNYDVADIYHFLKDEAGRPVAYTQVTCTGEVEPIMKTERMGRCARRAFNIPDDAE